MSLVNFPLFVFSLLLFSIFEHTTSEYYLKDSICPQLFSSRPTDFSSTIQCCGCCCQIPVITVCIRFPQKDTTLSSTVMETVSLLRRVHLNVAGNHHEPCRVKTCWWKIPCKSQKHSYDSK